MLINKVIKYGSEKGFKALAFKVRERINYKFDALKYIKDNFPNDDELRIERVEKYKNHVTISICVPVYNTDKAMLEEMLTSVLKQTYSDWELCIADGSDKGYGYIESMVRGINDSRIKYKKLNKNEGIVTNSNEACAMANGEYIALLDHDDVLSPDALYHVRKAIDSGADYIYSDEANFSKSIFKPDMIHFKPDYSIFNLRGNNYICHLSVFKRKLFNEVGGFRKGFEGSQDHDLTFRICEKANHICHIPKVLYFWRIHQNSVASGLSAKPYCLTSGIKAVESHLERMKIAGKVESANGSSTFYKVTYNTLIKPVVINNVENIKGVTNEYIIVAKPELKVGASAINEICQILQQNNVGIVGGMVVRKNTIESSAYKLCNNEYIPLYDGLPVNSDGYMSRLRYAHSVDSVNCSFFGVKKSVLENMGFFTEGLWNENKINDMCKRLKNYGYEIVFNPYAIAEK